MFVPCAVTVKAGATPAPAEAEFGVIEVSVGVGNPPAGVVSANGNEFETPIEFDTVTTTAPGSAASAAGINAVSCVAVPKVVVCDIPFQFTFASLVKFVPFTVSVKP